MGSGIFAFAPADPFLNLQRLRSLLPKQCFHQLWCIFPISSSYKLQDHHKTHCIYLKSWPCANARTHTETKFLQRTQVMGAELPYLPSYKQPGETRIAKHMCMWIICKLARQQRQFSSLHFPLPTFLTYVIQEKHF